MPSHITHLSVEQVTVYNEFREEDEFYEEPIVEDPEFYGVIAHLDSENPITLFEGTECECHAFVRRKLRRQKFQKWAGYLAAGAIGSLLTFLLNLFNQC